MNIEIVSKFRTKQPEMRDMQVGQFAKIIENLYYNYIVYCFQVDGEKWCVALGKPDSVWKKIENNTLEIELLPEGTTFVLKEEED
jgi:hypothetical protein